MKQTQARKTRNSSNAHRFADSSFHALLLRLLCGYVAQQRRTSIEGSAAALVQTYTAILPSKNVSVIVFNAECCRTL